MRSIPACAGEPHDLVVVVVRDTVYPRVCGGTRIDRHLTVPGRGLSPRVRGNHDGRGRIMAGLRSIPACAGEPDGHSMLFKVNRVYPRVCGGTPDRPPI